MNLSEADIIQLESYWQGQLSPTAQSKLEKRLAEDPNFKKAAMEWKMIITDGFKPPQDEIDEAADIKKRLLSYQQQTPILAEKVNPKPSKRPLFPRWVAVGLASAAAILMLFWLTPLADLLWQTATPSDNFFTHLDRDNANLSDDRPSGRQSYDQKNYALAYPALLAEVEAGGDSLNLIYAAVAAIGSGQSEKAIPILDPLMDANAWQQYQGEIQWYLALAYLNQANKEQAKILLNEIIETNGDYAQEAKKLMEELLK